MEDEKYLLKMQEFQLVIEQLIWLTSLSESILKSSTNISLNSNYSNFKVLKFLHVSHCNNSDCIYDFP
jgi:hypothetical protein